MMSKVTGEKGPRVTVFLTSYNHGKYIRESIDSVLGQSFTDFELFILDDGSTDDSWAIIRSYTDPRIRLYRNEINLRAAKFPMIYPGAARGEYVAIHHSDDIWEAEKLEKQVAYLDGNGEIAAVFSHARIIGEEGRSREDEGSQFYGVFEQANRSRHEWLRHFFYKGNALCHPSMLIRREVNGEIVRRRGMAQIPDMDKWVQLCLKAEIHVIQEKLVRFRERADRANASADIPENIIRNHFEMLQVLERYKGIPTVTDLLKIFPEAAKYVNEDNADIQYALGRVAVESEEYPAARLFGLNLLFEIMNDVERADKLRLYNGFNDHQFIQMTGIYDLFNIYITNPTTSEKMNMESDVPLRVLVTQMIRKILGIRGESSSPLMKILHKLTHVPLGPHKQKKMMIEDLALVQTSGYFDSEWYLKKYPINLGTGTNPAEHFLNIGGFEGRDPGPFFSSSTYIAENPDVMTAKLNPLVHYLRFGKREGRRIKPSFLR